MEFQKRGLPHAHILLIMHPESRLKTEEQVDTVIRADLPRKAEEPLLHDVVTRFMVHLKCGDHNPKASCMRDKKCRFRFPLALGGNRAQREQLPHALVPRRRQHIHEG